MRQHLAQTRQELSTALYQHDAAVRVIARLTKERDEARDALSRVTVSAGSGGAATNGDSMDVDGGAVPEEIAAKIDATQERYAFCACGESLCIDCIATIDCQRPVERDQFPKAGSQQMHSKHSSRRTHPWHSIPAADPSPLTTQAISLFLEAETAARE